jgi:hypothetical protein
VSPFIKGLLDKLVKPAADKFIANVKAARADEIAKAEALVASGTAAVPAVVDGLLGHVKASPIVSFAEAEFVPDLEAQITAKLGGLSTTEIPTLFDEGVAFLDHLDSLL